MNAYSVSREILAGIRRRLIEGDFRWQSPFYVFLLPEQGDVEVQLPGRSISGRALGFFSPDPVHFCCQESCIITVVLLRCSALIPLLGSEAPVKQIRDRFTSAELNQIREQVHILLRHPSSGTDFSLTAAAALLSLINHLF